MQQDSNTTPELDQLCINTIRALTIDAVQKAKSGHPGLPLGAAPMAYVLWTRFMRYNPRNPRWENRDRFLLSAGHGCMLLYSLLHLTGYDLPLDEIKNFRQWGSKTPGHPENVLTPGVEITTGPLGQGFANGVEGVASEAASLAGHLKLGKLIYLYDDNHVTIEGFTDLAFSEKVPQRFESYGWHTSTVADGNDLESIEAAIRDAQSIGDRPSLISVKTVIGYGMPTAGTRKAHSDPPGEEAVRETKRHLGWPEDQTPLAVALLRCSGLSNPSSISHLKRSRIFAKQSIAARKMKANGTIWFRDTKKSTPISASNGSKRSVAICRQTGSRICQPSMRRKQWPRASPAAK